MPRCNGSYIGFDVNPNANVASGIWTVREAETYLRSDKWPATPAVLGAPTGVALNQAVSLTWTAPASGSTPTDYIVQYSSNAGATWSTFSDGVSTATSATVTGLTNGTGYIFRIIAVNVMGEGPAGSASGTVTPDGDANFASVSVLLKFDGSSIDDLSSAARTVDVQGDAILSTAESKFGGKSLYCDGTGDGVTITHGTTDGFAQTSGDWTIEMWAYPTEQRQQHLFIISGPNLDIVGLQGALTSGGGIESNDASGGGFAGGSYSINVWQHFAFVRSSGTTTIYKDGVSQGTTSQAPAGNGTRMAFGFSAPNFGNFFFKGYLDDIRYTQGVARYTSDFTPPGSLPTA